MAFASGSITVKRFAVQGQSPRQADEELIEKLQAHAIGADDIRTADKTQIGWTTGEHILDTRFNLMKNALADGLHFAMRVDTHKAPPDLVRSYQRVNEAAILESSGREFLSKSEKREAREQALSQADKEARSGLFRRMKAIPVFWDFKRNEVYLHSAASNVIDQFLMLFRESFELSLVPITSGELAARWAVNSGETRSFDDSRPALFVQPPSDMGEGDALNVDEGGSRDFLGTEWLTWLWYASAVESPEITTQLGQNVTVMFEKSMQMQCAFRVTGSLMVTADGPTRLPEAVVALAEGKLPVRVGLQVASAGDAFGLSIRGDGMNYSSIQLPAPEDAGNLRAVFEDRIEKLRDVIEAVDAVYVAFLRRRLSGKWPKTLNAIRAWVASGRFARASLSEGELSAAS